MVKTEKDIKVVRVSEETQQMAAINILLDGERKRRSAARKKTGDQTWEVALSKDVFDRICQKERKVVLADFQRQYSIPVVLVNRSYSGEDLSCVMTDDEEGAYL